MTKTTLNRLEKLARSAAKASYSPYSQFAVGAAVLTSSGKTYIGTNVENSSFGLCNCAERTAIFTSIAAGEKKIKCVVVYTPTPTATPPCGACRQVINEFGPSARVISICDSKDRLDLSLETLLPGAFGPGNLG